MLLISAFFLAHYQNIITAGRKKGLWKSQFKDKELVTNKSPLQTEVLKPAPSFPSLTKDKCQQSHIELLEEIEKLSFSEYSASEACTPENI